MLCTSPTSPLPPALCLLSLRQVSAVAVKGPRYWPQLLLSGGKGGGLDALYKTQTLFVQRKAGALPYANDPSGVGVWGRCGALCMLLLC